MWLINFGDPYPGQPASYRPALILGLPDVFGPDFPFVIVAPMTTTRRGLSLHVEVEPSDATGLDEISCVQSELIRSVNRRRFIQQLGWIDSATSRRVASVVKTLFNY